MTGFFLIESAKVSETAHQNTEFLDTSQCAEVLGCTPHTVTRLIRAGHLPAVRLGPGRTAYRVAAAALTAFVLRYGTHEPADVAAHPYPDELAQFKPEPITLHTNRTPDGLLLVKPLK